MNKSQQNAITSNSIIIVHDLQHLVAALVNYLQISAAIGIFDRQIIEKGSTNENRMIRLLNVLKERGTGWKYLIMFLNENNCAGLAALLQTSANEPVSLVKTITNSTSSLQVFANELANYYRYQYNEMQTFGDAPASVSNAWVPLKIELTDSNEHLDLEDLQMRLAKSEMVNVALIRGDPGMGKSTLIKKIAYSWAVEQMEKSPTKPFTLVLAVPLRSVVKGESLMNLAVDFFLEILKLDQMNMPSLIGEISALNEKLLICLDGLDEYKCPEDRSFLSTLFATPFGGAKNVKMAVLPSSPHKVIITSRPYACEIIDKEFTCLQLKMSPLDQSHSEEFINAYCKSEAGKATVKKLLEMSAEIFKVPLMFIFVCHLADMSSEIPSNLTTLYASFVREMFIRERKQHRMTEAVDVSKWQDSNVAKSLAILAFEGIKAAKWEFSDEDLKNWEISNDCFTCGLLLYKADFVHDSVKADFPHRSFQEFFAAVHCYQLFLANITSERDRVFLETLNAESDFGRFFFGLCCNKSPEMFYWLRPVFHTRRFILYQSLDRLMLALTKSLSDCPDQICKQFGNELAASLTRYKDEIKTERTLIVWPNGSLLSGLSLNHYVCDAVGLDFKDGNWFLRNKSSGFEVSIISGTLSPTTHEQIGHTQILLWLSISAEDILKLTVAPSADILVIRCDNFCDREVNCRVVYKSHQIKSGLLSHISFGFSSHNFEKLKVIFGLPEVSKAHHVQLIENNNDNKNSNVQWYTLKAPHFTKTHELIKVFLRLHFNDFLSGQKSNGKCAII